MGATVMYVTIVHGLFIHCDLVWLSIVWKFVWIVTENLWARLLNIIGGDSIVTTECDIIRTISRPVINSTLERIAQWLRVDIIQYYLILTSHWPWFLGLRMLRRHLQCRGHGEGILRRLDDWKVLHDGILVRHNTPLFDAGIRRCQLAKMNKDK